MLSWPSSWPSVSSLRHLFALLSSSLSLPCSLPCSFRISSRLLLGCRRSSSVNLSLLSFLSLKLFGSNRLSCLQSFVNLQLLLSLLSGPLQIEELPHLARAEHNRTRAFRGSELLHELLTTLLPLVSSSESFNSLLLLKLSDCELCFGAEQLIGEL